MITIRIMVVHHRGVSNKATVSADDWDAVIQDLKEVSESIPNDSWIYIQNLCVYLPHLNENQKKMLESAIYPNIGFPKNKETLS